MSASLLAPVAVTPTDLPDLLNRATHDLVRYAIAADLTPVLRADLRVAPQIEGASA